MHVVGIKQIIQRALVSYAGVTTSNGHALGTTLVDSNLSIDYDGQAVLISSGSYTGQARDIDGDTSGGTVTVSSAFGGQIVAGTAFFILSSIPAMAEFDDIKGTGWTNENLTTIDANLDSALTRMGYEGATSLAAKLTAARAGYLDELAAANIPADVDAIAAALGNAGADMSAVTQSEAASLAAYLRNFRSHSRIHNQGRICLVVPSLTNLASDLPNTAIRAELDKIGTVSMLDQTGVDGGQEDWNVYNLIVVGSNAGGYTFTTTNIDDLILLDKPIMVCNADVAEHLLMGTEAAQSTSDVNEYCETRDNRVMQKVFGSTGEKVLFGSAQVSDRLNMSDVDLTEQVLMLDATGDGNTLVVVGWLPKTDPEGESYDLNDGSPLPCGRVFAGCFVHADHLTTLGQWLLRSLARNLAQAHVDITEVSTRRVYQEDIPDTAISISPDATLSNDPPSADAANSVVDIDKKTNRTFVLRSLFINISALGGGTATMTLKLWIDIGGTATQVDSVDVTSTGYQNLVDIFGLQEVHADSIHITAQVNAGTGTIAGIYKFAEAKK